MQPDTKLLKHWIKLLELPSACTRLTVTLYESMYTRGSFIAHYNREGFFRARFQTLADFDYTLEMMSKIPELKALLDATPVDLLATARYKIACIEASVLTQRARIYLDHVAKLQKMFAKTIIETQGGAM